MRIIDFSDLSESALIPVYWVYQKYISFRCTLELEKRLERAISSKVRFRSVGTILAQPFWTGYLKTMKIGTFLKKLAAPLPLLHSLSLSSRLWVGILSLHG